MNRDNQAAFQLWNPIKGLSGEDNKMKNEMHKPIYPSRIMPLPLPIKLLVQFKTTPWNKKGKEAVNGTPEGQPNS